MTTPFPVTLKLLPLDAYVGVNDVDPIRYYHWPVIGRLYRRRVELCLGECPGGERVLEIGFGSGLSFLNLADRYREIHGLDLTADAAAVQASFRQRGLNVTLLRGNVLHMPYPDAHMDTVLLISILEHLRPEQQEDAWREIRRVLRPGGHVVYGVPVERPLMVLAFRLMGLDIRQHHFSTEHDVAAAAARLLQPVRVISMGGPLPGLGRVYQVGHFMRPV